METGKIVVVDDEKVVTSAFSMLLNRHEAVSALRESGRTGLQIVTYFQELIL